MRTRYGSKVRSRFSPDLLAPSGLIRVRGITQGKPWYVFSVHVAIVVVVVLGSGSRGLPRWKRHEWRKQPARASLVPPRKTAEDDHDDEDEDDWDATLNRHKPWAMFSWPLRATDWKRPIAAPSGCMTGAKHLQGFKSR